MALSHQIGEDRCTIFAQDISQRSNKMLKLNLILNGLVSSLDHAIQGDTLVAPYHKSDDGQSLRTFDFVVSNPPFKMDFSDTRDKIAAMPARFWAGVPNVPAKKKESMATYSGFVKRLRPKTEGIAYDKYMAFFLRSKYFRKVINNNTIMTLRASFNEDMFSFLTLYLPDYEEQVKIGDMLYNIERKMRVNNRINDNLQQMAYDTYMHLFFKKQMNGTLGQIIVENNKSTVQVGEAKGSSGKLPFFTSGDAILEWNEPMIDGRNCYLNTGGNAGVKFYIGAAAYSTDTWCITANRNLEDYLYLLLLSIKPELNQKFFQGTGLKHLQKPLLKDRRIYIPSDEEIREFNSKIQPLMDMISANTRENKRLIGLRDWLLPMLMNGQATVND